MECRKYLHRGILVLGALLLTVDAALLLATSNGAWAQNPTTVVAPTIPPQPAQVLGQNAPANVAIRQPVVTKTASTVATTTTAVAATSKPAVQSTGQRPVPQSVQERPVPKQPQPKPEPKTSGATAAQTATAALDPQTKQAIQQVGRQIAFKKTEETAFPLTPNEIKQLHKRYDTTQKAAATPANVPPVPTSTSLQVNLSPGTTPPVIRLTQGFVSSLVFLDSTGAAWPIQAYDLGDPKAFNVQWDKKSNTLMVQATSPYTYGNLAIQLKGLTTPVMLTLIPGQKAVDYRVDLRVNALGPHAHILPSGSGLPAHADPNLLGILDGIPPNGSAKLDVHGGDAEAWLFKNKLYLRTHMLVLSPGWLASMSSPDGTHAYLLPNTPLILVSRHGQVTRLKLSNAAIQPSARKS